MNLDKIETIIRKHHGGAHWAVFHAVEGGFKFLPTGDVLTPAEHTRLRTRLDAPVAITAQDRLRNKMHAKASRHEGHS
jgi:hypothetical protein